MLLMARKCCNNRTENIILLLYETFMHPHLEHCVWFWYLQRKKEKVQRKAATRIGMDQLPHEEKLKMVGHFNVESRRLKAIYG